MGVLHNYMNKINIIPEKFEGLEDSIYAGFWARLGSILLDLVIMLPVILLINYLNGLGRTVIYFTSLINLGLIYIFHIYSVEKYGGSPGKLIVGIKIINKNGQKANSYNAWMRHLIPLLDSIFILSITFISINEIPESIYTQLNWIQRSQLINQQSPMLFKAANILMNIWVWSELLILLLNKRKRALHDYIGETVVIKKKYFNRLQNWLDKQNSVVIQCPSCGKKKRTKKYGKFKCSICDTKFESTQYSTRIIKV